MLLVEGVNKVPHFSSLSFINISMPDRIGNPCVVVVVVIAVAVVVVVNLLEDLLWYNSTDASLIPGLDIGG